jgi:hypothetical protein
LEVGEVAQVITDQVATQPFQLLFNQAQLCIAHLLVAREVMLAMVVLAPLVVVVL